MTTHKPMTMEELLGGTPEPDPELDLFLSLYGPFEPDDAELCAKMRAEFDADVAATNQKIRTEASEQPSPSAPIPTNANFEMLDWSGFTLAEIFARLPDDLTLLERARVALMTGRFATQEISDALKCSESAISHARRTLMTDARRGLISEARLPATVTAARSLGKVGRPRHDLRRTKRNPYPPKTKLAPDRPQRRSIKEGEFQ